MAGMDYLLAAGLVLAVILAVLWLGRPRKKRPLIEAAGGHKVVALSVAGRLRLRPRDTVRPARAGINFRERPSCG